MTRPLRAFISYRRDEAFVTGSSPEQDSFTERLTQALIRVGFSDVFVDTESMHGGDFFENRIYRAIAGCDLFIPLIGRDWLRLLHERQQTSEPDILAREVDAALRLEKDIVPLLIDGASMPRASDLPEAMKLLAGIDAKTIASDAPVETIIDVLVIPARDAAQVRRLGPGWTRGYTAFSVLVWLLCGIAPNLVGLSEFGYDAWVRLAAGWAGFFIWPIFFMPFIMLSLYRPFKVVLEATLNADSSSDALKYASPIIIGTAFALVMTIIEISPLQVPWSIHPKLAEHCFAPTDKPLETVASAAQVAP